MSESFKRRRLTAEVKIRIRGEIQRTGVQIGGLGGRHGISTNQFYA